MVMAKEPQGAAESLAARIKVAHDDVKHLPVFRASLSLIIPFAEVSPPASIRSR